MGGGGSAAVWVGGGTRVTAGARGHAGKPRGGRRARRGITPRLSPQLLWGCEGISWGDTSGVQDRPSPATPRPPPQTEPNPTAGQGCPPMSPHRHLHTAAFIGGARGNKKHRNMESSATHTPVPSPLQPLPLTTPPSPPVGLGSPPAPHHREGQGTVGIMPSHLAPAVTWLMSPE